MWETTFSTEINKLKLNLKTPVSMYPYVSSGRCIKYTLEQAMKAQRGRRGITLLFL
jgi:hypothetical protein